MISPLAFILICVGPFAAILAVAIGLFIACDGFDIHTTNERAFRKAHFAPS